MKAYSLKKAKELVRAFNQTRAVHHAAVAAGVPVEDAREILTWLERHDKDNSPHQMAGAYLLAAPLALVWGRFLFEHGISSTAAAAAVNWSRKRLFEKIEGPMAWADKQRKCRKPRCKLDSLEDPGPEELAEIAERLAEVRARHDAEKPSARVEIKQFVYDGRTASFNPN